jgi:hypothetical protein
MKNLLIALLLITIASGSIAQTSSEGETTKPLTHTISAGLLNAKQNNTLYLYYPCFDCFWYPVSGSVNNYLPGVQYTLSYKRMFARIGINGMKTHENTKDDYYSVNSSRQFLFPYLGFGGKVNVSRLSFLYGADLLLQIEDYSYETKYQNPEYNYSQSTRESGYGMSPFIGFSYKFTSRISLRTEAAFRMVNYENTIKSDYPNSGNQATKSTRNGSRFRANALNQISLDIKL